MQLIDTYIKETNNQRLEARIMKADIGYSIDFFVNGDKVKTESYEGKSLYYVEDAASNWLEGIKVLNG